MLGLFLPVRQNHKAHIYHHGFPCFHRNHVWHLVQPSVEALGSKTISLTILTLSLQLSSSFIWFLFPILNFVRSSNLYNIYLVIGLLTQTLSHSTSLAMPDVMRMGLSLAYASPLYLVG